MTRDYLILELPDDSTPANTSSFALKSSTRSAFKLQSDTLTTAEYRKLHGKPRVIAAPAMPLRLIAPIQRTSGTVPGASSMWGLDAIGATTCGYAGSGIRVAVLDTGIDTSHEAFAHLGGRLIRKNFTQEDDDDSAGHGTHCAGTLFGGTVKGTRIGVAPGVERAIVGKVLGRGATSTTLLDAINWALSEGANIISMSLGIDFPAYRTELIEDGYPEDLATSAALVAYSQTTAAFSSLARHVEDRGRLTGVPALLIAAAGNSSRRELGPSFVINLEPPASGAGLVSVSAVGKSKSGYVTADFANGGATLSGPGVSIFSAKSGGGLESMSGTSMAAPHVAGVAALWAEHLKETTSSLSTDFLRARLQSSVISISGADYFDVGAGLVTAPTTKE